MGYLRRYKFKTIRAYRLAQRAWRVETHKRVKEMERKYVGF